ncbi:MAG: class I SAM-dependent methyltransferase [Candidatus Binataceae bacterium]
MLTAGFRDSFLDRHAKIRLLRALKPSGLVLDYGCSWGYEARQLQDQGYRVTGFEISRPRALYARRELGLQVLDDPRELARLETGSFDVVFSSHVVEHLPNLRESFDLFNRLLADDGLMLHVLPNFGGRLATEDGLFWKWIGRDHPIAPTKEFFYRILLWHRFNRVVCGSGPFDENLVAALLANDTGRLDKGGEELFVAAWKS